MLSSYPTHTYNILIYSYLKAHHFSFSFFLNRIAKFQKQFELHESDRIRDMCWKCGWESFHEYACLTKYTVVKLHIKHKWWTKMCGGCIRSQHEHFIDHQIIINHFDSILWCSFEWSKFARAKTTKKPINLIPVHSHHMKIAIME